MKVIDQLEDFFRRRFHHGRALDAQRIRLVRGQDQDDRDRNRKHDG